MRGANYFKSEMAMESRAVIIVISRRKKFALRRERLSFLLIFDITNVIVKRVAQPQDATKKLKCIQAPPLFYCKFAILFAIMQIRLFLFKYDSIHNLKCQD